MLQNRNYDGSLRKTQWGICSTSRKVWWLDNSGSRSLQRRKWIPAQSPIRCRDTRSRHSMKTILSVQKQKFAKNGQESTKVSGAVTEAISYFLLKIHWNLVNPAKSYDGIIEHPLFIDQKQTELQNELYDEWKREHQLYYCNPDWMISGGQILCTAVAICEMSKISLQTGKLRMNEDLVNHLKDQGFIRNISQKTELKRILDNPKTRRICVILWHMIQQNYQRETTNSKNPFWDGIHRKERESQGRISRR